MNTHTINSNKLTISKLEIVLKKNDKVELSEESIHHIESCYQYLQNKIKNASKPIYGINTGFGSLYKVSVSEKDLTQLQHNLMLSHACGTGDEVPAEIVKLMLFLKIQSLSYGHSGVQLETVKRLIDFFNRNILPVVYQQGSLGASGDLAPLAHLCLPLIGEGEVYFEGIKLKSKEVLEMWSWKTIQLQAKEGLALLNGTQFMSAYASYCVMLSKKLVYLFDLVAATSLDAFNGRIDSFDIDIQRIRNHSGQIKTAEFFREFLKDSEIINQQNKHTQDPYSFRCIPQVHGATKDGLAYVESVIENEINAVTDNPNIFPEQDKIISGGNFHGQPLALSLDFLTLVMHELGNISERRTYQLISGQRDLPPYLVADAGINSGLMIPQYTAASIVSQNKTLCMPSSADSIVSSNGQEDHVSMGANAATKCLKVLENCKTILAIELLTASQALEFRKPLKSSPKIEQFIDSYRNIVPFIEKDRYLRDDIQKTISFIDHFEI